MALKASTGLRNAMMTTGSLKSRLDLGFIKIYAGTVPATADDTLGSATWNDGLWIGWHEAPPNEITIDLGVNKTLDYVKFFFLNNM